jgi:hypothetical protein
MNIFFIVLLTLIIYSAIGTLAYICTKDNETVGIAFGLGIVGLTLVGVLNIIRKIRNLFKYHIGLRSVFEEKNTGNRYKCKVKDSEDMRCWVDGYDLIIRYAPKSECAGVPDFSKDFIKKSKMNCDHCKHDSDCECNYPYTKIKCKHDEYGTVLEFDKFEKR